MTAGLGTADMRQKVDSQLTGDISAQVGDRTENSPLKPRKVSG
jgi:hypothetical protein